MKIHHPFVIPISESSLQISSDLLEHVNSLEMVSTNLNNSLISKEMNVLSLKEFKELRNQIGNNILYFLCEECGLPKDIQVEITSSWVNIHKKGDWAQSHKHMNSILSGVIYLSTPEKCGNIVFDNPCELFGRTIIFDYQSHNQLNRGEYEIEPKKNKLYLFPSHLVHSVLRNESDDDRISLAFNCYIRTKVQSEGKFFTL